MNNKITTCIEKSPLSLRCYTYTAMFFTLLLLIILFQGRYGKQETVKGVIRVPSYYRMTASKPGNIAEVYVKDGQQVKEGEPLFKVSLLWQDASELNGDHYIQHQTLVRLTDIKNKYENEKQLHEKEQNALNIRRDTYLSQTHDILLKLNSIERDYKKKREIFHNQLAEMQQLLKNKAINKSEVDNIRQMSLDNDMAMNKLDVERNKLLQEKADKEMALSRSQLDATQRRNLLDKRISDLYNEMNNIELQQNYTVHSPVEGIVHDVAVMKGDFVDGKMPSVILKQDTAPLPEAVIYLSGKQIGLLDKAQPVHLRVDSLPYENYGTLSAHVKNVSETPIELNLDEKKIVFRVKLHFDESNADRRIPLSVLKDGMTLTTSLREPRKSLIEWLFIPVTKSFKRNPDFFDE